MGDAIRTEEGRFPPAESIFTPMANPDEILRGLNEPQRAAVEQLTGPLLVLAGAGSGKTRVLTSRIAWAIACGQVHPAEVFAVTFTNKAAASMRERASLLAGRDFTRLWVKTFHSACAAILRIEHEALGLPQTYTIYDQDDQVSLVRSIIREEGLPVDTKYASDLVQCIQRAKDRLAAPGEGMEVSGRYDEDVVARLYALYNRRLRAAGALDFGDLIMETVRLFRERADVRARYAERFRFILVDEFQDTNSAQYALVHILGCDHGNVCVVGDDDQSIYSWRGADAGNFNAFARDFGNPAVIRLEQNYRSTPEILRVAAAVIAHNASRMRKEVWSALDSGALPRVAGFAYAEEEAAWVAREVSRALANGETPSEIAVFYRANRQSRVLEEEFHKLRIPYRIVGDVEFYKRREVKDLHAWLRVMVNPYDGAAFARLLQSPSRGIGEKTIAALLDVSMEQGIDLVSLAAEAGRYLPKLAGKKAGELRKAAGYIRSFDVTHGLAEQLEAFTEEIGFYTEFEKEGREKEIERRENVQELITRIAAWEKRNPGQGLSEYIIENVLSNEAEREDGEDSPALRVQLMTVHNAKGLEFERVFVTGMEEGVFPSHYSLEEGVEEERRLFYVAATRAKRALAISYAEARRSFTGELFRPKSRFLAEFPAKLAEWKVYSTHGVPERSGGAAPDASRHEERRYSPFSRPGPQGGAGFPQRPGSREGGAGGGAFPGGRGAPEQGGRAHNRAGGAKAASAAKITFPVGCRVRHKAYGEGVVTERADRSGLVNISVQFADCACTFIEMYAPLEKVK